MTALLSALAARFRRSGRNHARLAIEALPDMYCALDSAGLYAVYTDASPASEALLLDTARASRAKKTTLVLDRDVGEVVTLLREREFSSRAASIWPRRLNVLAWPPGQQKAMKHSDSVPVLGRLAGGLRAIRRHGLKSGSLYLIEGADAWFSWDDDAGLARESAYLARWCRLRRCSMVLLLKPRGRGTFFGDPAFGYQSAEAGAEGGETRLHAFHNAFSGVAALSQSMGEMIWTTKFWRCGDVTAATQSEALRFTSNGSLGVARSVRDVAESMLLTRDEHRVLATKGAIAGETWVPQEWEIIESNSDMPSACDQARGATVLLDYSAVSDVGGLCRVIHELRDKCGRAIKIVVRERGVAMRHQNELLALSVGANIVVSRGQTMGRLLCLIEALQGQLRTRPIIGDFRVALSAAQSDSVCGYLPIGDFCSQVRRVLDRQRILYIPHALLKLPLRSHVSHLEALHACDLRRAGDICSADENSLYVLLFGCPIPDVDKALEKVFGGRLDDYFQDIERCQLSNDAIAQLCSGNRRNPLPDYSYPLASLETLS
jgi:cellulose biosynthesis protein BcsE